ncbi:unnamed protein product [Macrosiphum euphorbiae]|uniref:C2H2-type domain-containing protein n=1 Tax=Macrosiphum euphorbiae TaxID=13131 RepID=A0AAV0XX05_9HEMI|nr:unnamed protein product [Macrosiphum euphorbiae]
MSTKYGQIHHKMKYRNEDTPYICQYCNKVFSRRVTLKKHLESHENSSSSLESEQYDDENAEPKLISEHRNEDINKPEKQNPFDNI